jgi:hypothetical protein
VGMAQEQTADQAPCVVLDHIGQETAVAGQVREPLEAALARERTNPSGLPRSKNIKHTIER